MKYLVFLLFFILLPAMGGAQNLKDYRAVVAQVVQCYNSTDAAGLAALYSEQAKGKGKYTRQKLDDMKYELREILSARYLRQREDGIAIFTVKLAKGKYSDQKWDRTRYMGIHLDKDKKITWLAFPTSASLNGEPRYFFNERAIK